MDLVRYEKIKKTLLNNDYEISDRKVIDFYTTLLYFLTESLYDCVNNDWILLEKLDLDDYGIYTLSVTNREGQIIFTSKIDYSLL